VRYVFDTSALIGAERRDVRAMQFLSLVASEDAEIVTPVVCVLEWWRGWSRVRDRVLRSIKIEPLSLDVAMAAGTALGRLSGRVDPALTIDAAVMSFAAHEDAPVVTSDVADFARLSPVFPGVRVLGLSRR
jgi:predicted nucleic acid-binding protein